MRQGQKYHDAVESAGYTFSLKTKGILPEHYDAFINPETGDIYTELPYYGEALPKHVIGGTYAAADRGNPEVYYGKINNPTVHIALNQVRKLINKLVNRYGHPDEIVVELARELKLGKKQKEELNKELVQNTKENERIARELERLNVKDSYDNRMKYKLWEDLSDNPLQRVCPFCGKPIGHADLFSDKFEIEHLLPFSRSYSDARTNKVISCRECNREKGNRSPWEAFHTDGVRWNEILARVENFSTKSDPKKSRAKKFREDAFEDLNDVLARMLTDTQYMAKIARQYLCFAAHPTKVRGIPGRLTAQLRHHWGLDSLYPDTQKTERITGIMPWTLLLLPVRIAALYNVTRHKGVIISLPIDKCRKKRRRICRIPISDCRKFKRLLIKWSFPINRITVTRRKRLKRQDGCKIA